MVDQLLDEKIQEQVREVFAELTNPVELLFFGSKENCDYCEEVQQLLQEVCGLSDQLNLNLYDLQADGDTARQLKVNHAPTIVLASREDSKLKDYGIRFVGAPFGHEFSSLINDILLVSKQSSSLNEKTLQFLAELKEPVLLQVFSTPT